MASTTLGNAVGNVDLGGLLSTGLNTHFKLEVNNDNDVVRMLNVETVAPTPAQSSMLKN